MQGLSISACRIDRNPAVCHAAAMPTTIRFKATVATAAAGQDLLGAILGAGGSMMYICMSGSCRTCKVRVTSGGEHLDPLTSAERAHRLDLTKGERLACQAFCRGTGEVVLEQ